ncbi:MAG: HAMP domain-containing sensor histidine kinase, partial [Eggerthellaceae bacterium]|nr:HAMP domain-containing sensor histidine kinase [Eggerthellaceae bacterium]
MGKQDDLQIDREDDLATNVGKSNLVFYLVCRFIIVLLVVMLAESAVVWLESITLLPILRDLTAGAGIAQSFETTSITSLLQWVFSFIMAMMQADYSFVASFASRSIAIGLAIAMLLLLAAPVLVGALVFARMVVRKVRALQAQRERELEQIDQQRSQFITDVAHDLRTPVMAISGMAHALSDGVVRDEAMREEYLQSICDKADKMSDLVSSVFDYTKLGSGSFSLQREVIDLSQLLLREAAAAYTDIEEADMHFSVHVPEERCAVDADPLQLGRLVSNLLANAVKHNGAGTEIALILMRQAGVAYVMVADTGAPITQSPDDLFQPFTQGDAARTSSKGGSGLGLSICKRIADMHGFNLSVAQPYGRFTKA